MTIDAYKVGHFLKEARARQRRTVAEVAAAVEVTAATVERWEKGTALPEIEALPALSDFFGVTINDILAADRQKLAATVVTAAEDSENDAARDIFVIGCGRWGTFIGWYLDQIGHRVTIYGRESSARMKELMATGKNEHLTLSPRIALTHSYDGIAAADFIVISISAQNLAEVAATLGQMGIENKIIVLCMKGIEIETGRRLSQVVSDEVDASNGVAVWLGPGHVQEFYRGVPNCMVIDSNAETVKERLVTAFSGELIRFYYGTDLLGNEIGAAAKNVVGIAAGMLEGAGMSSLKGALMARGTKEIAALIVAMGGNASSAYGLCHLGDYEATLFSPHSQNLAFGRSVVEGKAYHKLAEGYYTVKALVNLGKAYGVELPICNAVYDILYAGKDPRETLHRLFSRSLKNEF